MTQMGLDHKFLAMIQFLKSIPAAVLLMIGLSTGSSAEAWQDVAAKPLFGKKFPNLESRASGQWWKKKPNKRFGLNLDVPREQVVAFALYTHDHGVLKLSAQLFPLKPDEDRSVRLELKKSDGSWQEVGRNPVHELGWSAHFRIEDWDSSEEHPYRVLHGESAMFEGLIRKDPVDKDEIVVGSLSCNSSRTPGPRPTMIANLKKLDPDLLFFAGDQSYHHTEHTYGWLEFGMQFRDVLKDRPVVTIPDDHDVGQANIWGEKGKQATNPQGPSGGYYYPAQYVNMVQRCQTWHLPDPVDPQPIDRGINVYFTRLRVGGVDFAILEDRKFKSGPEGKIPRMGPRPDHINDKNYDPNSIDLPNLKLLGDRQLHFLDDWSQDWLGAEMKCVLSQTAFCGAVHLHGNPENRLLADLDCNGWPQTPRNRALAAIRRAWAVHLCGDQHLSVVVKHGIETDRDGPYAFTSPAIVNTIYGRWWQPADRQAGPNPVESSPLPWTGDFRDGLGNRIHMMAYANPQDRTDERKRADGFGIARFNKKHRTITFEAWPRFANVDDGQAAQFPGWPITVQQQDNDGRKALSQTPSIFWQTDRPPVVQLVHQESNEIQYTVRLHTKRSLPIFRSGAHQLRVGFDRPDKSTIELEENKNERPTSIQIWPNKIERK